MKKKVVLIVVLLLLITVGIFAFFSVKKYYDKINEEEITSAIPAIVIGEDVPFYDEPKTEDVKQIKLLEKGENVYILEEFEENNVNWYKVKVDKKKNGYVRAEFIDYYEEVKGEKVLMADVSQFNTGKNFGSSKDFELFLVENKIGYVYIRAGGRGYGAEGKFYIDEDYQMYVDACEYLKIPYGFYFLEEALTSKEIDEEVEFISQFLDENKGKHCVLPVALDIEKHDGNGRADDIWTERHKLVKEILGDLDRAGIDSIVYTNAQTANLYLNTVQAKFWLAYYPEEGKVPNYWYFDTEQPAAENVRLQKKTIGWQFTEHGAGDEIPFDLDLSLVKKNFYKK